MLVMHLAMVRSLRITKAKSVTNVAAGSITAMRRKSMAIAHAKACQSPVITPGFNTKRTKV